MCQINSVDDNIVVNVGNVDLNMIIDSGASCNIMGRPVWEQLKRNRIDCVSATSKKVRYAYRCTESLKVAAGTFNARVKCNDKRRRMFEFCVIEGKGQALLGRATALKIGVLQLAQNVTETVNSTVFDKLPECFKGVGKLKSFQLEIPIDDGIEPVIQPMRRLPFKMRDKLEKKLNQLIDLDIIERVEEPSRWMSPVICVPKGRVISGSVLICVLRTPVWRESDIRFQP